MATAPFSPFEYLLIKSRSPVDTASLLLLAWVLAGKHTALVEDEVYLQRLALGLHTTRELKTLIDTAHMRPSGDLQLAAEVLIDARADKARLQIFLRQAIGLAASDGSVSQANVHILGFLADLASITPSTFALFYQDVTGRTPPIPVDPSSYHYWQGDGPDSDSEQETCPHSTQRPISNPHSWIPLWWQSFRARRRRRHLARQRLRRLRRARARARARAQEQQQQQQQQAHRESARQEQASRERERERERERYQRERTQQEKADHEQHNQKAHDAIPPWRRRLALKVLELDEHASPHEIRKAYRRLAQRHHPDRFHHQGERRMALASQRFQRIQNAYDYLTQHA